MSTYYYPKYIEPRVIKGLITHDECDNLINIAKNKTKDSTVGINSFEPQFRTSKTYQVMYENDDEVIKSVRKKCGQVTTFPDNYSEFQITHYKTGGFYGPHHDRVEDRHSKRVCTVIIALNDDYEGGETNFIYLYNSFKMNKGDALLFYTTDQNDKMTDFAMHEGTEVTSGEKWIANVWMHDRKQNG
jgi:predicted 2-oxoglutarate/Fe(II)-dependent dioxygenase YbiX|tara:strand:+ start:1326 stop:1886 length:561 start_codon:yes stop_codon:yes gene_type:complete